MISNTAQRGHAAVNGINLYYEIHGTGQPLVLLHGGLGAIEMFGGVLSVHHCHQPPGHRGRFAGARAHGGHRPPAAVREHGG